MELAAPMELANAVDQLRQRTPDAWDVCRVRSRSAHVLDERRAFDELHREEADTLVHDEVVQGDKIRMRDVGEAAKFPLQPIDVGGTPAEQRLERHSAIARPVVDLVDDPHAADAESAANDVALGSR